ncbi:hypothetical protein AB833_07970 [Chromatiales bacterium (ex Bugula neritina AB1)]|nr:hypothetical protein AB833_07970 [Chromatiales bacterium (ex Bugula neritina AB1)]
MIFEWDSEKNLSNIRKHGVSFETAKRIFDGYVMTTIDDRFPYPELRECSIGIVDGITVLVVIHTDTDTGKIRLISARKATRKERTRYEKTTF